MERFEKLKASIRAKVEHPFHVLKNLFKHRKTRYRGLPRTRRSCFRCSVWLNLVLAHKRLMALDAQGTS